MRAPFPGVSLTAKNRAARELYAPILLMAACLAAQLTLVFSKSFNWDEFLHFSFIYQIDAGTFSQPFQVFHLRLLAWAPHAAANLLDQMRAARLAIWGVHLATLLLIFGTARQFAKASTAFFAAFAYLTAGYVFTQGFSIRGDPIVAATLMLALFLMAKGEHGWAKAAAIGALVGLAGMMTFKTLFYAPCFAGLAWLQYRDAGGKRQFMGKLALVAGAAALSFTAVYFYHTWNFAAAPARLRNPATASFYLRWLRFDMPFAGVIGREIVRAPLFFISAALAPFAWKKAGLKADARVALAGFLLPLAALLFYRNTFPYLFVFLLAPVAVAIAPALEMIRERYGALLLSVALAALPLTMAVLEPRDVLAKQQALVDYVHREFPAKTGYLDYSGMISDYPRVLEYLTSGNGIRLYNETGDPILGREIDRGNVPFIIANHYSIEEALEGRPLPGTFLAADLAAMQGNYVRQWGVLWREGSAIPAGARPYIFRLRRGGDFVLSSGPLTIDGAAVEPREKVRLGKGAHSVAGGRAGSAVLWRGERLPSPPPKIEMTDVFTDY